MRELSLAVAVACAAGCVDRPLYLPEARADLGGPADLAAMPDSAAPDLAVADFAVADSASTDLAALPSFRQMSPLSTSTVTTHKPTFRWTGAPDGTIELCLQRDCATTFSLLNGSNNQAHPSIALAPGPIFWRVRKGNVVSPVWELFVGARDSAVDSSYGSTLDVNGDGLADVGVGQPATQSTPPAAYVYLGGSGASNLTRVTTLPCNAPMPDWIGCFTVAGAGDLNGDGFGDFAVGSVPFIGSAATQMGMVQIYYGGADGVTAARGNVLTASTGGEQFGRSVGGVGDVNGDGYGDLLVTTIAGNEVMSHGWYIFFGGPDGVSFDAGRFISVANDDINTGAVSAAGDFNGDGFGDFVLSDFDFDSNRGQALVYYGGAGALGGPTILTAPVATASQFSWSLTTADIDGDGYADVIAAGTSGPDAYVFPGGPKGVSTTARTITPSRADLMALAGDFDGDGRDDLLVDAFNQNASLYLSGPAVSLPLKGAALYGLGGAGDTNGDHHGELLAGSSGQVLLFTSDAPDGGAALALTPPDGGTPAFGYSIAGVR